MTHKRETTTILAIAIMAAAMVGALIALAMMREGVGIQHANAKLLSQHVCKKKDEPGKCGHGKVPVRKRA